MNRRDFLLFRTEGSERLVELSCQKLYVHYQGLCSGIGDGLAEAGTPDDADWWAGEPPLQIAAPAPEEFFRGVQHDLQGAHKVRVLDMEWMDQGEFRIRVETLLSAFRATGGEVSYGSPEPEERAHA